MKKILKLFIIVPILFSAGCDLKTEEKEDIHYTIEDVPVSHDYSEVKEFEIEFNEIFTPNLDCYFVYFYSINCNHCQELKDFMIEKALERNDIYFVKASNKVPLEDDVLYTIGAGKTEDIAILGYPSMLKIEHHIVTKNVAGQIAIKQLLN